MATTKRKIPAHMTIDEFLAWPGDGVGGRYQLVDGEVRAMSPAGTTHGTIQANLARLVGVHLDVPGNPCSVVSEPAIAVRMNAHINQRVPDLGVSCAGDLPGQIHMPDPILLIEIMSPGNSGQTWDNVWAYTTIPTVKEILVIQSSRIEAEMFRRHDDGNWPQTSHKIDADGPLQFATIAFEVPLRAAYAKTYLVK